MEQGSNEATMDSDDSEQLTDNPTESDSESAMEEEEEEEEEEDDEASDDSVTSYDSDDSEMSSKGTSTAEEEEEEKALEELNDRISALPDSLLLQILTLLPTKSALKTTVLSKRWQFLPTFLPILVFNELDNWHMNIKKHFADLRRFVTSINHTLIFNQLPKLQQFRVRMKFLEVFNDDVDAWMRLAMQKNVEELELNFSESFYCACYVDEEIEENTGRRRMFPPMYVLPRDMLRSSSLVTLKLTHCEIQHFELIDWKSLKVLSLSAMDLSNDMIRDILSGCPSLESMELRQCIHYDFVEIKSERVSKLVINEYSPPFAVGKDTLKVVASNIHSLDLSGYWSVDKFSLINSSSLVDAKLNFSLPSGSGSYYGPHREYPNILKELLEKLQHVKDLSVGNWCLQVISVLDEKAMPSQSSNRVCLRIETQLSKWCLPGITKLLALTPLLETLVINMTSDELFLSDFELEVVFLKKSDFYDENYWPTHKRFFEPTLLNLKTVEFVNGMLSAREIYLILFLLKNAKRLQKMIIQVANVQDWCVMGLEELLEVVQIILSCPKCSPDAVISFCFVEKKRNLLLPVF